MASYFFKRAVLFSTLSPIETSMEKFSAIVFFYFWIDWNAVSKNGDGVKIGEDAKCGAGAGAKVKHPKCEISTV